MEVPLELDLTPFMVGHEDQTSYATLNNRYAVYSAIIHHGEASYGHYVALSQAPNGQWYLFNDETVRQVPPSDLQSFLGSAYMLFYKRSDGSVPLPEAGSIVHAAAEARQKALGSSAKDRSPLDLCLGISRESTTDGSSFQTRASATDVFASDASTTIGSDTSPSPCAARRSPSQRLQPRHVSRSPFAIMARLRGLRKHLKAKLRTRQVVASPAFHVKPSTQRSITPTAFRDSTDSFSFHSSPSATKANSVPLGRRGQLATRTARSDEAAVQLWPDVEVDPSWQSEASAREHQEEVLPVAKRRMDDIDYDRGKLKKKRCSKFVGNKDQRKNFDLAQGRPSLRETFLRPGSGRSSRIRH